MHDTIPRILEEKQKKGVTETCSRAVTTLNSGQGQ